MLHVLLLILKIIGILLLSILGLLVLLIGILLFVPIRYKVVGVYQEKGVLRCQVHWLLRLFYLGVNIDTKASPVFKYGVKIFGFTIMGTDKKPKKPKKQKSKRKPQKVKKVETIEKTEPIKTKPIEMKSIETKPTETKQEQTEPLYKEQPSEKTEPVKDAEPERKNTFIRKCKKIWKKLIDFLKSIPGKIKNIKYTIEKMCDKIVGWRETYEYYRDLFDRDETKAIIRLCKKQLVYIGKKLKPQKFLCNVRFGLEDPAAMGQILAIYGMLYPAIGNNVLVQADFERVFVEGDIYIKGKLKLYTLIKVAVVVYFNKNVKTLLKLLKREEVKDGRK